MNFRFLVSAFFVWAVPACALAQSSMLPVSNTNPDKAVYSLGEEVHTSRGPLVLDSARHDSILYKNLPVKDWQTKNWFFRKLFTEHLLELKKDDYELYLDFLPDMWVGKQGDRTIWNNTRELAVGGRIGEKFSFNANVSENQGKYPLYVDAYIRANNVIPGRGNTKIYKEDGFDFSDASANLSYTPTEYLNIQAGYGKNFIGNGYRSLLLSDFAYNYPYLKLNGTLGPLSYSVMWAQFQDLEGKLEGDVAYNKKYGVFHYLDWNVNDRLSLGLFENIIWEPRTEWSYFIPLLFLRPAEMKNGSPDKVLIGLNGSYKISDGFVAYGQGAINEFTFKEVFAGDGYWANKLGGQIGLRAFDLFEVANLNATAEFNTVRPYTYSARRRLMAYGHYNEPLAHPYGANFREFVGLLNYRYKRWTFSGHGNFAQYGLDVNGENYGKNIFLDYTTRKDDYGVKIGHGLKTDFLYMNATFGFLRNPKNNLRLEMGATLRRESNSEFTNRNRFITFGLRSSFKNIYWDF